VGLCYLLVVSNSQLRTNAAAEVQQGTHYDQNHSA